MEAWSKVETGFVTPVVITRDTLGLRIVDVENNPVIYKVWRGGADGDTCFFLENRQHKGFDSPLPGAGLLVWHIDPGQSGYDNIVDLEEDNTFHLDLGTGVTSGSARIPSRARGRQRPTARFLAPDQLR